MTGTSTLRAVAVCVLLLATLGACVAPPGAPVTQAMAQMEPAAARAISTDDSRGEECGLQVQKVLAVIELASGQAFWEVFPSAGRAPELEAAKGPVYVAVFDGPWTGPLAQNPLLEPSVREEGTVDVCAVFDGARIIYTEISPAGMNLPSP